MHTSWISTGHIDPHNKTFITVTYKATTEIWFTNPKLLIIVACVPHSYCNGN